MRLWNLSNMFVNAEKCTSCSICHQSIQCRGITGNSLNIFCLHFGLYIYIYISTINKSYYLFITLPPEGVARYCFHPVCLSVCLCICLCVCVCVRPIFWYFISRLLEKISISNLYRTRIGCDSIQWKKLTFIGQRSRSQGRYIDFWRCSHITKTEP